MPVGLRDRRTWRRRGPPARTLVIGTDARYWHQRALSAPTRVVDMSARYIPLAVSTTPSQCRQPTPVSATPSQCRQRAPTPVPGECPSPASDCSSERLCPPRPGGFPRKAESTTGCLGCPRARGMPYFLLQWEERNERCPLVSRDCLCPPRVRGTPARARAGRSWRATRTPRVRGTPARARAGPRSGFPQVVRHPWGYAHKNPDLQARTAHKGAIPPLCAAPCFLIPSLVCDTEKERGQDPRGTRRTGHSCCTA